MNTQIELQQVVNIPSELVGPLWDNGFTGAVVEFACSPIGYGNGGEVQILIARCATNWVTLVWNISRRSIDPFVFEPNYYFGPSYSRAVSMMELLCQEYVGQQCRWLQEVELEYLSSAHANA